MFQQVIWHVLSLSSLLHTHTHTHVKLVFESLVPLSQHAICYSPCAWMLFICQGWLTLEVNRTHFLPNLKRRVDKQHVIHLRPTVGRTWPLGKTQSDVSQKSGIGSRARDTGWIHIDTLGLDPHPELSHRKHEQGTHANMNLFIKDTRREMAHDALFHL